MKKKIIYFFTLSTAIISLILTIHLNSTYSRFTSNNVKVTISLLASDTFNGRLAGTAENIFTADIIRKRFESSGVKPFNGSYKENFNTLCPVATETSPYFKIFSNGEVEEDLKYGVDFKEDMLNFKSNEFTFSKTDIIKDYTSHLSVTTPKGNFLFYVPENNDFSFRSSFISDFRFDAIIMVTKNIKSKIIESIQNGKEIAIHVPFNNEEKTISNVVGVINGTNSTLPPLIITAHFDHLGKDGLGNNYSGALDNASGTAFMLELQRSISTFGKPKRDIIFIALNAEEFGLLGSKYFAENNYFTIKGAEVLNFDMIGSANYPITFMQGVKFKDKSSDLLTSLQDLCKKNDTDYEVVYQDSSDHASFNNLGIDAVSFCHSDMTKIHTPKDTVDYIDTDAIDTVYTIVNEKIKTSCYSGFTLFLYSKNSVGLLSVALLLLILWPILDKKLLSKKR